MLQSFLRMCNFKRDSLRSKAGMRGTLKTLPENAVSIEKICASVDASYSGRTPNSNGRCQRAIYIVRREDGLSREKLPGIDGLVLALILSTFAEH